MRELERVFNRKTFLILAVLCAMNLILFLLSIDPEKMITQQGAVSSVFEKYGGKWLEDGNALHVQGRLWI